MPTENRSSNTELVSDSEMTECQFHNNCGGWCETRRELEHNLCEHCLESHDEEMAEPAPAPQPHADPESYPPCDYCGTSPGYHPWHGSGMLNGVENRHIHACNDCRRQLPSHPGQPHPDPIAWMVGTAFWWTKEEAERDAAEVGQTVVGLGPMTECSCARRQY
ncbi:hypothetical protein C6A77_05650 [Pseudomonas sp. AFG_SD02_1510_Pfu_092]|uniref:hypothetical protein n=1 Tax=Pseudomonas sp. AFG_SD02_1510_Pfu_092 TaxID=2259497 RepID=UPI000DEF7DD8|nr:hypothetical protein [Pseudomonas sp. AFG_SD02_1510_Pfu_092]RCL28578.1 hypothetical protein C6A77_05650 [Pseudomonas sp. AFG_SD02_1510_Pfu_092]